MEREGDAEQTPEQCLRERDLETGVRVLLTTGDLGHSDGQAGEGERAFLPAGVERHVVVVQRDQQVLQHLPLLPREGTRRVDPARPV